MYNMDEISKFSEKCLNCKVPMCKTGCPISTNIPEFINKIKEKDFETAYKILQENNIMSEICSRVCPVENQCMGSCIRGKKGQPIQINILEKFVNDWAKDNNISYKLNYQDTTQKEKVAIIGAGPAGLACAVELKKNGYNVTVFEKEESAGGILKYGIPDFRLSKELLKNVIDKVIALGIEIKTNVTFGKDITWEELKNSGYEVLFLGIGAENSLTYKLSYKPTTKIYKSDEFLKLYNEGKKIENLGTVVVIGGGNVAFDSARTAARIGADRVCIVYRRNKELMPAREIELKEALNDGVEIVYNTKVIKAEIENDDIKEIICVKTRIEDNKAVDIEDTEFNMKADNIIFAIGSRPNNEIVENLKLQMENGLVRVDENYMTNIENIYAGGDLVESKSSVCRAIATGKKAAYAIIKNFRKESER